MSSDFLYRSWLGQLAGKLFGGSRDLYNVYGYKRNLALSDFEAKYARQDIAARIIDAPVQATWRREPAVTDDNGPEGAFTKAWEDIVKAHRIYYTLERLDRLAGLGQYAVLLMGFPGATKSTATAKANGSTGTSELLYIQPYKQASAAIETINAEPTDPRFGKPEMYKISVDGIKNTKGTSKSIEIFAHHSRVLHVATALLEDEVYGVPRMESVYNLLDDLLKVAGGSAEMFWLNSNRGMQIDVDPEMEMDKDDAAALEDETEDYINNLSRVMRTRGVTMKNLGADFTDPTGVFYVLMALIAGAKGIPLRILLGSERGELASEQDRSNWANRVEERQKSYATPVILEPFLDKLIAAGALTEPKGDIVIKWPDAFAPSPLERAQTMAQKARAATNLSKPLKEGGAGAFYTPEEAREIMGLDPEGFTGDTVGEIPGEVETPEEDSEGQPIAASNVRSIK